MAVSRVLSCPKQTPPYCRRIVGFHQQLLYFEHVRKPHVASGAQMLVGLKNNKHKAKRTRATGDPLSTSAGSFTTLKIKKISLVVSCAQIQLHGFGSPEVLWRW